jgi:hypothetical protein
LEEWKVGWKWSGFQPIEVFDFWGVSTVIKLGPIIPEGHISSKKGGFTFGDIMELALLLRLEDF